MGENASDEDGVDAGSQGTVADVEISCGENTTDNEEG
jgi:hypothetical protein